MSKIPQCLWTLWSILTHETFQEFRQNMAPAHLDEQRTSSDFKNESAELRYRRHYYKQSKVGENFTWNQGLELHSVKKSSKTQSLPKFSAGKVKIFFVKRTSLSKKLLNSWSYGKHSVENEKFTITDKKIRQINFFSKNVSFTKFVPKMCDSKFHFFQFSTLTVWKNEKFSATQIFSHQNQIIL